MCPVSPWNLTVPLPMEASPGDEAPISRRSTHARMTRAIGIAAARSTLPAGSELPLRGWLFGPASRRTVLVDVFLDPGRIPEPCLRQVLGVEPTTASWLMNPPPEAEGVDDAVPLHPTRIALSRRATAATVKRNNLPIGALSIYEVLRTCRIPLRRIRELGSDGIPQAQSRVVAGVVREVEIDRARERVRAVRGVLNQTPTRVQVPTNGHAVCERHRGYCEENRRPKGRTGQQGLHSFEEPSCE